MAHTSKSLTRGKLPRTPAATVAADREEASEDESSAAEACAATCCVVSDHLAQSSWLCVARSGMNGSDQVSALCPYVAQRVTTKFRLSQGDYQLRRAWCIGVARSMKWFIFQHNILLTISLIIVILLRWLKSLLIGWYCDYIKPPIDARRAQWVASRSHHTFSCINIIKFGQTEKKSYRS